MTGTDTDRVSKVAVGGVAVGRGYLISGPAIVGDGVARVRSGDDERVFGVPTLPLRRCRRPALTAGSRHSCAG
jgi:hypothetical protein